jgi:serine/threonine protein kinase
MVKGELQSALADRYTIERELGRGGMATVYLAQDVRHDRPVALKVREGRRALEMLPISRDAYFGAHLQLQLVRITVLVGHPDQALDQLEPLLRIPFYLSRGWLRLDPAFNALRNNPRFRKLVEGTA